MEYNLEKKCFDLPAAVLDSSTEQPVDIDLTLPDYCPDIERILCCRLVPKVYSSSLGSDRLSVDGASCVRILYVDSDRGCVRSYEYSQPFSASVPVSEHPADCAVYIDAKPGYINCRALSPRKLSLHGAFSLNARVVCASRTEYFGYRDGDLQLRRETASASRLSGACTESFSFREEIPAGVQGGIVSVLSHSLCARITELKAVHGKIMLSAELKLELLYLGSGEDCPVGRMSYSLPLSRIVDCAGADESSVIDGRLDVLSSDVRLGGDVLDGSALISLEAKLNFAALCFSEIELELITDAFSKKKDVDVRLSPFSCPGGMTAMSFSDIGKANITVEDSIVRILDLHSERLTCSAAASGKETAVSAKLRLSMLYENTDGELRCVERDAEFLFRPDTGDADCVESIQANTDSLSFRLTDASAVELRAELSFRLMLCRRSNRSAVTRVTAEDDAPDRVPDSSLILYYSDGGESVWSIAKRFGAKPGDIAAENGLEGEDPETEGGMMLLIPIE